MISVIDINHLVTGLVYEAQTSQGHVAVGEYLGIEPWYGERRILLRSRRSTESIPVAELVSVSEVAA